MVTIANPVQRIKTSLPQEYLDRETGRGGNSSLLQHFLGIFSIGLGLWETTGTQCIANRTGVRNLNTLRLYGAREIIAGLGILASRRPGFWLWSRVVGDAIDLATIAAAYRKSMGEDRIKNLEAAGAVLGVTVLDLICASECRRRSQA